MSDRVPTRVRWYSVTQLKCERVRSQQWTLKLIVVEYSSKNRINDQRHRCHINFQSKTNNLIHNHPKNHLWNPFLHPSKSQSTLTYTKNFHLPHKKATTLQRCHVGKSKHQQPNPPSSNSVSVTQSSCTPFTASTPSIHIIPKPSIQNIRT